MNCKQAKNINIVDYLDFLGFKAESEKPNQLLFRSPIRVENNASFSINPVKNIWYDHGIGKGGDLIDLVGLINNCSQSESLQIISKIPYFNNSPAKEFQNGKSKNDYHEINKLQVKKIQSLQNKALIEYVINRRINLNVAKYYLKEVYYLSSGNSYFSLAFKNYKKGYETRNKYFKGCIAPKAFTYIAPYNENTNGINIFEGFFDFLTALCFYKTFIPLNPTIVLNSLSILNQIESHLSNFRFINLYLDNDDAGIKTANYLKEKFSNEFTEVKNQSEIIFPKSKDFNDFGISQNANSLN